MLSVLARSSGGEGAVLKEAFPSPGRIAVSWIGCLIFFAGLAAIFAGATRWAAAAAAAQGLQRWHDLNQHPWYDPAILELTTSEPFPGCRQFDAQRRDAERRKGNGILLTVIGALFLLWSVYASGRNQGFEQGYDAAFDELAEMPVRQQIIELRKYRLGRDGGQHTEATGVGAAGVP
jgi:hypothetical protein